MIKQSLLNVNNEIFWNANSLLEALNIQVPENISFESASIDSRSIKPNQMFIGLKGEKFNGSDYALQALDNGASCVLIDAFKPELTRYKNQLIIVDDVFAAMQKMAMYRRNKFKGKVVGITGSVGKTSTKELMSIAFGTQKNTFASFGNFNNHYGMPLNIINIPLRCEVAILEMGMSSAGELNQLSQIAKPDVALITAIEAVHLEFFKSTADIAHAKAEIFSGMKPGGIAILNISGNHFDILKKHADEKKLKVITFGDSSDAEISLASYAVHDEQAFITAKFFAYDISYKLNVIGKHLAVNSLGVLSAAFASGLNVLITSLSMPAFSLPAGRGAKIIIEKLGIEIIDDCYNASPASMKASIDNLKNFKHANKRIIAVLGDMRELGVDEVKFHQELLEPLLAAKLDKVHTIGNLMQNLHEVLPANIKGLHFEDAQSSLENLKDQFIPGDIILFKASNSMNLKSIIDRLKN